MKQPSWPWSFLALLVLGFYLFLSYTYFDPLSLPSSLWAQDGWVQLATTKVPVQPILSKTTGASQGELLYGLVAEQDLPWFSDPPLDLRDLRARFQAERFITAFRTTLPDPILHEEDNVAMAASYLAGTVIQPHAIFSLNHAIGPRTTARGFGPGPLYLNGHAATTIGGGICKVATTMYNVGVYSDLHLVERHAHSMLVPYVPPGRDATLLWGQKDLRFLNDKGHPLVIWAAVLQNTLYISLYGQYDPPRVEWHNEESNRVPTWTVRRKNLALAPGEILSVQGFDGISVKTWVSVDYPDQPTTQRYLGSDYYKPMPNYVDYGP